MNISQHTNRSAAAVREAIVSSGLTKKRLSELTGIPSASLSRKLSGRSDLSLRDLYLLAEAMGVSPAQFVSPLSGVPA